MKKYAKTVIYDRLHKSVVVVCVGLTLYGSAILANHAFNYFKYVKPRIDAAKLAAKQELLSEGSSDKLLTE